MNNEFVVDIEAPEVQVQLVEAQNMFEEFYAQYNASFDLSDEAKIVTVYEAAIKDGILSKAREIRRLVWDYRISTYGVNYDCTKCNQNCKFCPIGQANWRMYQGGKTSSDRLITLSLEEASQDLAALVEIGHGNEICMLAGEAISSNPIEVVGYAQLAFDNGAVVVVLNMGAYNENIFRFIRENIDIPAGAELHFRVFQETYDLLEYERNTERAPQVAGSKRDFAFRYNSQVAALRAGWNEVGFGALFGLSDPLEEIKNLQRHATYIHKFGGKYPNRCCLPIANNPEPDTNPVDIKYLIPGMETERMITELIYALARLALAIPERPISIVMSERNDPETLEMLDEYADHTTLFVHPTPGGNIEALAELRGETTCTAIEKVGQAEVFPRHPADALRSWKERGYEVIGFDKAKYGF